VAWGRDIALGLLRSILFAAGLLAVAAGLTALIVVAVGADPSRALLALHAGSIGTRSSLTETLIKTTPLLFTGLSVAIAFRCGIWNIGAEGQFLAGMLGAAAAALALPPLPTLVAAPICLVAGAAAGALCAALPAALKLKRGVPEVISTIMLNFLTVYLIQYLVRGPMKDPKSSSDWSSALPPATHLPRLGELLGVRAVGGDGLVLPNGQPLLALGIDAGRLHVGVLLAVAVGLAVWFWLARSRAGFRLNAVGRNPEAAQTVGIPVGRTVALAFLLSGALAGLGGAVEILGLVQRMYGYNPGSPGYGFSGIAVALLGQLHPAGVMAAALFFGALAAGCSQMQRSAGVSFEVAYVIQAALVLLLVALPASVWRKRLHLSTDLSAPSPETPSPATTPGIST
jgi:simple sugar transport system permease protein